MPPEDPVVLAANAGTATAEDLHAALVMAVDTGSVTVSAGAVQSVGQAVLQLLAAAHAEARARNLTFSYSDASDAFAERVRACRLGPAIGFDTGA